MRRSCSFPVKKRNVRLYQTKTSSVFGYNPDNWNKQQETVSEEDIQNRNAQPNIYRFIQAHRQHGYKHARLNPVPVPGSSQPAAAGRELDPDHYGVRGEDRLNPAGLVNSPASTVSDLAQDLTNLYCGTTAIECEYMESAEEKEWLYTHYETVKQSPISSDQQIELATEMLKSQAFDNFLASKFGSIKRYGGEGAEAMVGFYIELLRKAQEDGVQDVVVGMAHRGRLNLMTGLFQFPPVEMFRKMRGLPEFPADQSGAGDVLSHLTSTFNVGSTHVTMLPNPSHLEAVNPVAVGKARCVHLNKGKGDYGSGAMGDDILCVQVHGDAALAGQGINQETLQIANVPHYSVGGSIHLVINNQVGFTTPGERGRSSRHCTDLAKQVGAPVIHVNGDHPEELVKATRLAMDFRAQFRKDVFVNLICFRRWGHNELDDPTFTNPAIYSVINARGSVPDQYFKDLVAEGVLEQEARATTIAAYNATLNDHFNQIDTFVPERSNLKAHWSALSEPSSNVTTWDTGLDTSLLKFIGKRSVSFPEEFNVHSHLLKHHVDGRIKKMEGGSNIDWGTAEALAMGSLLYQGFNVRISGQDVGRATFSHRHAMLVDQASNEIFIPFNNMEVEKQGRLEIANSILSEEAVMAFEYGMSVASPNNLIIWEAQFGDFFNGAQIILDTFVSNGESKWGLQSGLVMLLPHGMDGAGPEHSSCRMERFLQMTDSRETASDGDNVNWEVVQPTTAAQYFHVLRRQMVRNYRKPLVVVAPKVLLRLPAAASTLAELSPGSTFSTVLSDPAVKNPDAVEKVIFVSGRHYYTLSKHIQENQISNVAVIRLESLCPFPAERLQEEVKKFKKAKQYIWSQEEHRNQGPWSFVAPRFQSLIGLDLSYRGRGELCQPAVGVGKVHQAEVQALLNQTFS